MKQFDMRKSVSEMELSPQVDNDDDLTVNNPIAANLRTFEGASVDDSAFETEGSAAGTVAPRCRSVIACSTPSPSALFRLQPQKRATLCHAALTPRSMLSGFAFGTFDDTDRQTQRKATLQRRIFIVFDEPDSSLAASLIGGIILILIFASSVSFCVETVPWARERPAVMDLLSTTEVICIVAFTVEYVIRVLCCTHRLR